MKKEALESLLHGLGRVDVGDTSPDRLHATIETTREKVRTVKCKVAKLLTAERVQITARGNTVFVIVWHRTENPARAAFWAAVRKHSKPVDWDTVAPVPRALIERNAQAKAIKAIKAAGV